MDLSHVVWHPSLAQKGQTPKPYLEACGARQPLSVRFSARILKRASSLPASIYLQNRNPLLRTTALTSPGQCSANSGQHFNDFSGARPAEGPLRPVNQVTLAVHEDDAVQDRRESRSSLRPVATDTALSPLDPVRAAVD